MISKKKELSDFFNVPLCANNKSRTADAEACREEARYACGKCHLVQYCSKECQTSDWKNHKLSCKSGLMKDTWKPEWVLSNREPAFMSPADGAPLITFGGQSFLWGNMPAFDVLNIKDNEGEANVTDKNLAVLFAASGDLRNALKTITGLPGTFRGACTVVMNDRQFVITARNAIMLLVALHFDTEVAVPMVIHIWYSALLPRCIVDALESTIKPLVDDVCRKIESKPTGSLQSKTFARNGSSLRLVLKKEEWFELAGYFTVPTTLTLEKSHEIRRRVTLAPERVDYRDRARLQWSGPLRELDARFRRDGVFLPYGCSQEAFDTPNPTLFHTEEWLMKDSSDPRQGWRYDEYMKHAPIAHKDEHGAIFFYVRNLLVQFCTRLRDTNISFQMFNVDAQDLGCYVPNTRFDRIEIANICDRGYLGPMRCFQLFAPLLKTKLDNPKATLIMLFINAAAEEEIQQRYSAKWQADLGYAMKRLNKHMPLDPMTVARFQLLSKPSQDPDFMRRSFSHEMLRNWDQWFDVFLKDSKLIDLARLFGLMVKDKHTVVEPWPCKVGARITKEELEVLLANGLSGYERYMEFGRCDMKFGG